MELASINIKESVARLERITSTLVLHNPIDGADTRFYSLSVPLDTNPLDKWLEVIRRGSFQKSGAEKQWAYETVKKIFIEMVIKSDSINDNESTVGSDNDEDDESNTVNISYIP